MIALLRYATLDQKNPKTFQFDNNELGLLQFGKALYEDFLFVLGKTKGRMRMLPEEFYEEQAVQDRFIAVQKEKRMKRQEAKDKNYVNDDSSNESLSSSLPLSTLSKSNDSKFISHYSFFYNNC